MLSISIANDFTQTPGLRHRVDSEFSGEQFRDEFLEPKYLEAKECEMTLLIDLDGGYGYPTSFLEEAFGGLARRYDYKEILKILKFKSADEPGLIREIESYITGARK